MIVIVCALVGAIVGSRNAKKRGGNRLDMAQYAAGYGIAFAIAGLILTLALDNYLL